MTNDLVTRLRNHIAITTKIHYSPKDGYPEPVMVHGPSPICQEAADEIERLRKELDTRIAMCDMRSERIIELENLIDSALEHVSDTDKLEADHNNNHFRSNYK